MFTVNSTKTNNIDANVNKLVLKGSKKAVDKIVSVKTDLNRAVQEVKPVQEESQQCDSLLFNIY